MQTGQAFARCSVALSAFVDERSEVVRVDRSRRATRQLRVPRKRPEFVAARLLRFQLIRGHAFVQNLRRGHYELGSATTREHRLQARSSNYSLRSESDTVSAAVAELARSMQSNNATVPS